MKKLIVYSSISIMLVLSSCFSFNPCIEGVGSIVEETREITGFYSVANTTSFHVYVTQADTFSVLVAAQENLLPIIETNKSGSTLIIKTREFSCIRNNDNVEVYVTLPEIEELSLTGSGRIVCERIDGDEVELSVSSSGRMFVDTLYCTDAYIRNSGSGQFDGQVVDASYANVKISGSGSIDFGEMYVDDFELVHSSSGNIDGFVFGASKSDVSLSGSGRIVLTGDTYDLTTTHTASGRMDLLDLEAVNVRTRSSGSGNTFVNVNGLLDVTITASGSVLYVGDPTDIDYRSTGSGELSRY